MSLPKKRDHTSAGRHGKPKSKKQRRDTETSLDNSDSDAESDQENTERSMIENSILPTQVEKDQAFPGVIKQISVKNFMCHNRLVVKLGSHVNFIVGRNGSGKSAIITALVVGLGGKATITNRGSSIRKFIKSGKRNAEVEITLNNKGKDSYKHDLFGDKIIIRRKFNVDGASSYSVHAASGNHISARREEICRITDHFNIQADNPVCILNQDTSRNFLNTKSPGDKFKFFMKATQLEQMCSDYDEVMRLKEQTRHDTECKEQTLDKMKKEVKFWENKFRNLAAITDLKVKVKQLKNEMAWAIVAEREKELKPLEKALATDEAALPRFTQKVDQSKEQMEEWETRYKELEQEVIKCSNEVKNLEPLLQEKRKDVQKAKEKMGPLQNQLKAYDRELRSTRLEKQQCEERIEELKTTASHDYEAERRQREEQIGKLEARVEEMKSKQRVTEHEMEQYRGAVAKLKTELAQNETNIKIKRNKLREVKMTIQNLQAAVNDRLRRFGLWMPDVIKAIQSKKASFHKIPIGPLGICFELADYKWALALEVCLKGLVSSFVCHDNHDERILEDILSRHCPKGNRPSIITSAFKNQKHDVSRFRAKTDKFLCMLDVILTDNPVVSNILVDQRGIENILLIEDDQIARDLMMRNPPQNVKESFGLLGEQSICKPTYRMYSTDKQNVKFLMQDVKEQVALLQKEQEQLEQVTNELGHTTEELNREMRKNQQGEKASQTQLNKITESVKRFSFEIRELQSVEDPEPVDVTTLEEEVAAYNARIEELQTKRHKVVEDRQEGEAGLEKAKKEFERVEREIREKSDNGIPLREEIKHAQDELGTARSNHKYYLGKLKEQEGKIGNIKKDIEKFKKELEEDREKALQISQPIRTQRTANNIDNEITQIQRRIEEEEREQGNEEEIRETYKTKKETLNRVKKELQHLKNFIQKLDESMMKRQEAYTEMRKIIAFRTKYYFRLQLFQRNFNGQMMFDFEKQTLDILINTAAAASETNGKNAASKKDKHDLKSLSGGERSFSTVCFILSLWEAMEAPFRCLDEFDVFMDMVNRRVSMDMMMETADMHKSMQFIFLTPQDMSATRKINNVKIFRMPDPERHQTTLNFSQGSQE